MDRGAWQARAWGLEESDMAERLGTAQHGAGRFLNGSPPPGPHRLTQRLLPAALHLSGSIQGGAPLLEAGDTERGFLKSHHSLPRWPQAPDLTATPTFLFKAKCSGSSLSGFFL